MKTLKWMSCLSLISYSVLSFAAGPLPQFQGSSITEEPDGYKMILKFFPKIPSYKTVHSKSENGTEIRWRSSASEKIYRVYKFNNEEVIFKRMVLWVDPVKKEGILQVWHRGETGLTLVPRRGRELVVLLKEKNRQIAQVPMPPVAQPLAPTRRINLNVKDVPLQKILRTLATEAEKSIVFGNEVEGAVTVNVKDMSYEQAVDTILKPTKYRAEHSKDATIIRSAKEGKSFRIFHLNYVDVNPVLKQVQDMSKEASVSIDANTNTLFMTDTVENLNAVERMLIALDKPPRQVEVETAIIELSGKDETSMGFNLDSVIHHGEGAGQVIGDISTKRISPFDPAANPKGMFVGLTWNSVRGILGMLNDNSKLSILARPRVVALNDQEANIIIGEKIGYNTLTVSQTGTVQDVKFLTVGTQLKIKPHITSSNDILMLIKPEISDGRRDPVTGIPSETTTSSETKILAKDGQTIVLGGLLRDKTEKLETKVPILGDIPVIGFFFKGTSEIVSKGEIVILLSPRLVDDKVLNQFQQERTNAVNRFYERRLNSLPPPKRMGD